MQTPEFMPVLSRGDHKDPRDGACLLEYISILAGEPFSDHPKCVDPVLGSIGRTTNDTISNRNRHLLVPLIPRLIGTAGYAPEPDDAQVHVAALGHDIRVGGLFRVAGCSNQNMPKGTDAAAWDAWEDARDRIRVEELTAVLDAFDAKYRPRTVPADLSDADKKLLLEAVPQ